MKVVIALRVGKSEDAYIVFYEPSIEKLELLNLRKNHLRNPIDDVAAGDFSHLVWLEDESVVRVLRARDALDLCCGRLTDGAVSRPKVDTDSAWHEAARHTEEGPVFVVLDDREWAVVENKLRMIIDVRALIDYDGMRWRFCIPAAHTVYTTAHVDMADIGHAISVRVKHENGV